MVQIPITESAAAPRAIASQASQSPQLAADVIEELTEIECPLTGEIVGIKDIDGLIDCYERLAAKGDAIKTAVTRIRMALAEMTEGDQVTRRIRGKRRAAKVTLADVSFDQPTLKALWNSHPKLTLEYLKIGTISVQMTPYKKLTGTSSTEPDFIYFRDSLTKADRGRTGTPSITVEG